MRSRRAGSLPRRFNCAIVGSGEVKKRRREDGMVFRILALLAALAIGATQAAAADKLVVAVNKLSAGSPLYIARAKGFFAEQNLDVSLLHATSAQTIGLAVASGDARIGMTAVSVGIYTIACKGAMKIVAGGYEEMPGFKGLALHYNRAVYEAGKRKPSDPAGMKGGTTQTGSPQENQLPPPPHKPALQ